MSNPPVHVLRYSMIKVCIWQNHTPNGDRYSITVARIFKNGDKWSESSRFGRDDLLVLAKLLDQAHSWIYEATQSD